MLIPLIQYGAWLLERRANRLTKLAPDQIEIGIPRSQTLT